MGLYDPEETGVDVPPEQALAVVHAFLTRARSWATEREIPKRVQRVAAGGDMGEAAKLTAWVVWRDFVDHALQELEDGTLDSWFSANDAEDQGG